MDCVFVEGLEVYAYHGVDEEERLVGHRFVLDAKLFLSARSAGQADDPCQSADYGEVAKLLHGIATSAAMKTVEAVAERIADALLQRFPACEKVWLRVAKLGPPVGIPTKSAGVEIERSRH